MLNRDSMIAKMNLLQSDTAKIRFLQETALTINAMNPELMLFLADSSFTIAQNLKLKHEMAIGQRLRAFAKQRMGRMSESMREYLNAIRTFEEVHDTVGLAHCYNGLGIISFEQKKYDQALEYYIQSYRWFKQKNVLERQSASLSNAAYSLLKKRNLDSASRVLSEAIAIDMLMKRDTSPFSRMTLGEIALARGRYDEAAHFGMSALQGAMNSNNKVTETRAWNLLGMTALQQRQEQAGLQYLQNGLKTALQARLAYRIWESYEVLSRVSKERGDIKAALTYLEQAESYHETIVKEEQSIATIALEVQHEKERRERETSFLIEKNNQQRHLTILLSIGIAFVLGISLYLFVLNRRVRNANKLLEEQKREIELQKELVENQSQKITHFNTELASSNQALVRSNKELESLNIALKKAEKNRMQMLSIVAHDLRSPLSSVLLMSEFLQSIKTIDDNSKMMLQRQSDTITRLIQLTKDLVDAAAQELGMMKIDKIYVNIALIVQFVVEGMNETTRKKKQTIILERDEKNMTRFRYLGDEKRLIQVMENIIGNASKYAPLGSEIHIRLFEDNAHIRLEVQDQGPGFTEEDKTKMFGFFQRLSAKPTGKEHSSGVGLAIVKHIVELHGGTILCFSEAGKGATFIVELPKKG